MNCKKCHKEIPDGSMFCNHCGKKQETTKRKKAKRANGTGSIRVDKRNKHRPYYAYSPKTKYGAGDVYIGAFATLKDAQQALDKYNDNLITNKFNDTLSEIYESWSVNHFKNLTKNGEQGYKTAYKYLDTLYNRKMRDLKTADYQSCIDRCAEKYSRSQCEKVKQLCSQLCKYAMQNDVIDKNYAEFIKLPKAIKKEKEIFTDKELQLLWQHSDDARVQQILILCYTGFRVGEFCDLLKENVHLNERYIIGGKKTQAGINRYVPIQDDIYPFVKNLYTKCTTDTLISMDIKTFRNNVFYSALADLHLIDPPTRNPKTNKLEYKNPRLTPHCTRHTFATLCVNAGVKAEQLQKIIGHAKFETTADIYVHENTDDLQNAIHKLKR